MNNQPTPIVRKLQGGTLLWIILLLAGCGERDAVAEQELEDQAMAASERFIDAFYSWDAQALAATMQAPDDAGRVLYYQGWAQAGNYQVQTRRPCIRGDDNRMVCAITVTDDIGGTLGYVATDTFRLTLAENTIVGVEFAGDDPPLFEQVLTWIIETRPEVMAGPCKDMFAGGTTPADCVRAVVRGAKDYLARET